jgi:hypothetical protein
VYQVAQLHHVCRVRQGRWRCWQVEPDQASCNGYSGGSGGRRQRQRGVYTHLIRIYDGLRCRPENRAVGCKVNSKRTARFDLTGCFQVRLAQLRGSTTTDSGGGRRRGLPGGFQRPALVDECAKQRTIQIWRIFVLNTKSQRFFRLRRGWRYFGGGSLIPGEQWRRPTGCVRHSRLHRHHACSGQVWRQSAINTRWLAGVNSIPYDADNSGTTPVSPPCAGPTSP